MQMEPLSYQGKMWSPERIASPGPGVAPVQGCYRRRNSSPDTRSSFSIQLVQVNTAFSEKKYIYWLGRRKMIPLRLQPGANQHRQHCNQAGKAKKLNWIASCRVFKTVQITWLILFRHGRGEVVVEVVVVLVVVVDLVVVVVGIVVVFDGVVVVLVGAAVVVEDGWIVVVAVLQGGLVVVVGTWHTSSTGNADAAPSNIAKATNRTSDIFVNLILGTVCGCWRIALFYTPTFYLTGLKIREIPLSANS